MARITLYADKINRMYGLIEDVKKSVIDYNSELFSLKTSLLSINKSVCNMDDIISFIQASSQTQERKIASLDTLSNNVKQFVEDVVRIDREVADHIRNRKNEFYEAHSNLRPECEKNGWEELKDGCKAAGEWCREHWKTITTILIVVGAVLAIAAVICTGGMALAPLLAMGLTALGVGAGTALTIATVTSLAVAGIAVTSTLVSSTLNIMDLWGDYSGNSTFQSWKTAMNWVALASNLFYSVGSIYNSFKGISNSGLREYGKIVRGNNAYLSQINTSPNSSLFWSGLGKGGDKMATNVAGNLGKNTLEMTLDNVGVKMPLWPDSAWKDASSAFAWNSSGEVSAFLGKNVAQSSIWRSVEYPLLQINPNVSNITGIVNGVKSIIKYFSLSSLLGGLGSASEAVINTVSLGD